MASVVRINITPVKGLGLQHPDEVELTERGVESNRRYYLISGWRLYNGKDYGPLVRIAPEADNGTLAAALPRRTRGRGRGRARRAGDDELLGPSGRRAARARAVGGRALGLRRRPRCSSCAPTSPATGTDVHVGTIVSGSRRAGGSASSSATTSTRGVSGCCSSSTAARPTRRTRGSSCGSARRSVSVAGAGAALRGDDAGSGYRRPHASTRSRASGPTAAWRDGKNIDFGVYFDVVEPGRVRVGDAVQPV